jgi:hypothetical protein
MSLRVRQLHDGLCESPVCWKSAFRAIHDCHIIPACVLPETIPALSVRPRPACPSKQPARPTIFPRPLRAIPRDRFAPKWPALPALHSVSPLRVFCRQPPSNVYCALVSVFVDGPRHSGQPESIVDPTCRPSARWEGPCRHYRAIDCFAAAGQLNGRINWNRGYDNSYNRNKLPDVRGARI